MPWRRVQDCRKGRARVSGANVKGGTPVTACRHTRICERLTRSLSAAQTFLGVVTSMRYDLIQAAVGAASGDPVMTSTSVTWQRSCAAMERIATHAALMQKQLPDVVAGLRAVAPQLEASCVAPPRDPLDSSRVATSLGKTVAAALGADVYQLIARSREMCRAPG